MDTPTPGRITLADTLYPTMEPVEKWITPPGGDKSVPPRPVKSIPGQQDTVSPETGNPPRPGEQENPENSKFDPERGYSGVQFFTGLIRNEEYLPELTWRDGIAVYDRMRRSDAQVKATLQAIKLPIRQARWFIEPASDNPEDTQIAEIIEERLLSGMQITWDDFVRMALTHLEFGFSVFEKVWEMDGNLVS